MPSVSYHECGSQAAVLCGEQPLAGKADVDHPLVGKIIKVRRMSKEEHVADVTIISFQ